MRPFDSRSSPSGRGPLAQGRRFGPTLVSVLTAAAIVVLAYEAWTLIGSVLLPLSANPNALQTDFHYYYYAAQRFTRDRSLLYLMSDDVIAGFTYPPPAILPFMMLATMPLGMALTLLTVASYAALWFAIWQWTGYLARHQMTTDRAKLLAITVIATALGPTYMNAIYGQVNAFVLLGAVMFVALAGVKPPVAGVALALGTWLKIYPALLAWTAAWDRRARRSIAVAIGAGVAVVLLTLVVVPMDAYRTFFFEVIPARSGHTAIHITNQSLIAFLERFHYEPQMFLNWTGQQAVIVSPVVTAINLGGLGISLVLLYKWVTTPQRAVHATAMLMALMAIAAPLGWGHTYVMVLPLVVLRLLALEDADALEAIVVFLCVAALMVPAGRHLPLDGTPAVIQNLVYSRYLLATLVLSFLPFRAHEIVIAITDLRLASASVTRANRKSSEKSNCCHSKSHRIDVR